MNHQSSIINYQTSAGNVRADLTYRCRSTAQDAPKMVPGRPKIPQDCPKIAPRRESIRKSSRRVLEDPRSSNADLRRSTQLKECPWLLLKFEVREPRYPSSQICPGRSTTECAAQVSTRSVFNKNNGFRIPAGRSSAGFRN